MSETAKDSGAQQKSGLHIPGFAQLQRLGKSLMLPIAVLPAAGILLRLGQDDLLGRIKAPVIGPFFQAMSAAGGALFNNLALLFAVGVAIGFARKADGSTALSAVVGYLVMQAVFKTMSPFVLAGELDKAKELLAGTGRTLAQTSKLVGYEDEFYFSRVFKRITGMTPSAYAKLSQKL